MSLTFILQSLHVSGQWIDLQMLSARSESAAAPEIDAAARLIMAARSEGRMVMVGLGSRQMLYDPASFAAFRIRLGAVPIPLPARGTDLLPDGDVFQFNTCA